MLTSVKAAYQLLGLVWSMALKPPSPPQASYHSGKTSGVGWSVEKPGEPLSCVPPSRTVSSVGCCENEMNWVSEPRVGVFRSWKEFDVLQLPFAMPPVW